MNLPTYNQTPTRADTPNANPQTHQTSNIPTLTLQMKPSLVGTVVSQGKMDKTVKIQVRKLRWNRVVSKYVTRYNRMLVHDELNKCRVGDIVRAQYVRPLSPRKSWAVAEIMKLQGSSWEKYQEFVPAQVRKEELERFEALKELQDQRTSLQGQDPVVVEARDGKATGSPSLELHELEKQIAALDEQISQQNDESRATRKASVEANRLLTEEPERAHEILKRLGKNPSVMKPGIVRNILLRHLVRETRF